MTKERGFSLVESLVVIAIISIVVGVFAFINNTAKSQAVLDKAQTSLIAALQDARNKSAAGFKDSNCTDTNCSYGVRIESDKITFLVDENDTIQTPLPPGVSAEPPADPTIIFDRLNAVPNITENTSIILRHNSGLEKTIIITEEGLIEYE